MGGIVHTTAGLVSHADLVARVGLLEEKLAALERELEQLRSSASSSSAPRPRKSARAKPTPATE